MVEQHLCAAAKKNGVLDWSGSKGSFLGLDYGSDYSEDLELLKMIWQEKLSKVITQFY